MPCNCHFFFLVCLAFLVFTGRDFNTSNVTEGSTSFPSLVSIPWQLALVIAACTSNTSSITSFIDNPRFIFLMEDFSLIINLKYLDGPTTLLFWSAITIEGKPQVIRTYARGKKPADFWFLQSKFATDFLLFLALGFFQESEEFFIFILFFHKNKAGGPIKQIVKKMLA